MEPYLDILPKVNCINITRLQISCHSLAVELGRHNHPQYRYRIVYAVYVTQLRTKITI